MSPQVLQALKISKAIPAGLQTPCSYCLAGLSEPLHLRRNSGLRGDKWAAQACWGKGRQAELCSGRNETSGITSNVVWLPMGAPKVSAVSLQSGPCTAPEGTISLDCSDSSMSLAGWEPES